MPVLLECMNNFVLRNVFALVNNSSCLISLSVGAMSRIGILPTFLSDYILVHCILPDVYEREGSTTEAANKTSLEKEYLAFPLNFMIIIL